jgi:membrane fusion protein (multidrug efflux system)
VERSRFSLEQSQIRRDETLQIDLPREDETLREQLKRTTLALEKARNALDLTLNEKRISLEKEKREYERAQQQLEKLQQDRQKMELRAPADGVVYYGRNVDGKWPGISSMTNQLRPFGKVTGNDVLVTIVRRRPMHIRATVPEKDLQHVQPGVRASSTPTARSDQKVDGVVMAISNVPVADGEYAGRISAPLGNDQQALMPGMTCKVRLVPYEKAEAITIPPAALQTEPTDDSKHFVTVVEDDEQRKQSVTVGKRTDSRVEILSGLQAGDRVLLSAPNEEGS